MKLNNVVVVGAGGAMGSGIAQRCAQHGLGVTMVDVDMDVVERGVARIEKNLSKGIEKGKLTEQDKASVLSRLSTATSYDAVSSADLVIESVLEDLEVKRSVFETIDRLAPEETILATNTTSLSISAIASATRRPERVVQMHFFNPPFIMKLVEIMPGEKTSPATLQRAEEMACAIGCDPVVCRKEAPGGIVSRVLGAMLNEASWLCAEGIAEPDAIDKAMELGARHPLGPMKLLDLIGLDVHRAKMKNLHESLGHARYDYPALIDHMVERGNLGRKSGQGFHRYDA